jgi:predicted nucleic acid-binding protein
VTVSAQHGPSAAETNSGADVLPSRIVLDTSAYSRLRRAEPRAVTAVAGAEVLLVPATVLGELDASFRIWIAAATLDSGAHLVTFEDFARVAGLPHTLYGRHRSEGA